MFELTRRNHNKPIFNPFAELEEMERQFLSRPFSFFETGMMDAFKTDIRDEGDKYELEADLPGFEKKDINIDIDNNILKIKAERHSEHEDKDKKGKYVTCERSYGMYSREFDLSGVNADEIKAKYENGVLKLTLPKKQQTLPEAKRLEIE